jgi:hypothetical protein
VGGLWALEKVVWLVRIFCGCLERMVGVVVVLIGMRTSDWVF